VNPQDGLHYVGYPIADLADLDPEAAVFLLLLQAPALDAMSSRPSRPSWSSAPR
jgi:hypothetical protein